MNQGYLIYCDDDSVHVRGSIDGQTLHSSRSAGEVFDVATKAVQEGGEIKIGPGVFRLDRPVHLPDDCWLRGSGPSTILRVGKANAVEAGVVVQRKRNVVLSDFKLVPDDDKSAGTGICITQSEGVKVREIMSIGFSEYGLMLGDASILCRIIDCTFAGNGKANLRACYLTRGEHGDFIPNLIANCMIYGGGKGIDCQNTIVLNIANCVVYQSREYAYHLYDTCSSVALTGCRTFQIGSHAVMVEKSNEINLSGNIFCWHTGDGIVIKGSAWGAINGNEIIDSGSYNPNAKDFTFDRSEVPPEVGYRIGIDLAEARGYSVSGNAVFNFWQAREMKHGIVERESCHGNVITGNTVNFFLEEGIVSKGRDTRVEANVCCGGMPYIMPSEKKRHLIQSFRTELVDALIAAQVNE